MGRLIDIDEARKEYSNLTDLTMNDTTLLLTLFGVLDNAPTVEAIPKDQYEARLKGNNELINDLEELRTMINKFAESYETRLKADLVAMLTELQIEFDEKYWRDTQGYVISRNGFNSGIEICVDIIQEKINALKGVEDGNK